MPKEIDWSKLQGTIISQDIWLQQINVVSLNHSQAKRILHIYGIPVTTINLLNPGKLIVLNHRHPVTAICKDDDDHYRYVIRPENKKPDVT